MKYCLSIGLHNLYFDVGIVDENHCLIVKNRFLYDRSKDISKNIDFIYKKYFSFYKLHGIGISISSNIKYKDDVVYSLTALNIDRYNLKQAMEKTFKMDVTIIEERYAASLGAFKDLADSSLLYIILDNKISNSFVINGEIAFLNKEIDFLSNEKLNIMCGKNTLKTMFLENGFDDEYIGGYFLSNNRKCKEIIGNWAKELNKYINKIFSIYKVDKIVFAGNLGVYYPYFKEYIDIPKSIECDYVEDHVAKTIKGVSHLIFKDN